MIDNLIKTTAQRSDSYGGWVSRFDSQRFIDGYLWWIGLRRNKAISKRYGCNRRWRRGGRLGNQATAVIQLWDSYSGLFSVIVFHRIIDGLLRWNWFKQNKGRLQSKRRERRQRRAVRNDPLSDNQDGEAVSSVGWELQEIQNSIFWDCSKKWLRLIWNSIRLHNDPQYTVSKEPKIRLRLIEVNMVFVMQYRFMGDRSTVWLRLTGDLALPYQIIQFTVTKEAKIQLLLVEVSTIFEIQSQMMNNCGSKDMWLFPFHGIWNDYNKIRTWREQNNRLMSSGYYKYLFSLTTCLLLKGIFYGLLFIHLATSILIAIGMVYIKSVPLLITMIWTNCCMIGLDELLYFMVLIRKGAIGNYLISIKYGVISFSSFWSVMRTYTEDILGMRRRRVLKSGLEFRRRMWVRCMSVIGVVSILDIENMFLDWYGLKEDTYIGFTSRFSGTRYGFVLFEIILITGTYAVELGWIYEHLVFWKTRYYGREATAFMSFGEELMRFLVWNEGVINNRGNAARFSRFHQWYIGSSLRYRGVKQGRWSHFGRHMEKRESETYIHDYIHGMMGL